MENRHCQQRCEQVSSRATPSGKIIYYYQARGGRTVVRTTGKTTPSAARAHCRKLEKACKLIPKNGTGPVVSTFGQLARDFWKWEKSAYIHAPTAILRSKAASIRPALRSRHGEDR